MSKPMPKAVTDLLVTAVGEELLLYTQEHNEAICLNSTAALVFQACDGETARETVAERLAPGEAGEALLDIALGDLAARGLIPQQKQSGMSRRHFLHKWGTVAAALPLVAAVATPLPAAAASVDALSGLPGDGGADAPGGPDSGTGIDFFTADGPGGPDVGTGIDAFAGDGPAFPDAFLGTDNGIGDA